MNTTEMVQIALDLAQLQELPLDSSVSVPGENITRVLAGIDMGAAELTLARQLGYDCVARHHNMVPRLGKLGELVAQSHYEKLVHYGVPVNVAQKLLEHRKRATEIMFHGSNLDGGRLWPGCWGCHIWACTPPPTCWASGWWRRRWTRSMKPMTTPPSRRSWTI